MRCWRCSARVRRKSRKPASTSPRPTPTPSSRRQRRPRAQAQGNFRSVKPLVIHRVTELDLQVAPRTWPFAEARRAEISAHFAAQQREHSHLWNGRVLIGTAPVVAGERLSASYFEVDFASFLAWRDWGFPDKEVVNGFGMGALRASDGAFMLGEMGGQTANAG